jgi:phage tail-like protein
MATTNASTYPNNPALTYNFMVKWDSNYVAAVSQVTGLTKTTAVVPFRAGGQPQTTFKIPGQTDYQPITLMRGITTDVTFEQWANKMWYYPNTQQFGEEVSLSDFRKDIQLEMYNQAGQLIIRYNIYRCWPSSYTALPDLDAGANVVALATLVLQNEGWDRDTTVTAPTLPSFTQPSS